MPLNPSKDWKLFTFPPYESAVLTSVRPSNLPNVTRTIANTQWGKATNRMLQATNGALVRPEQSVLIPIDETDNQYSTGPWNPGDTITRTWGDPADPNATTITYTIQVASRDGYYWFLGVFDPTVAFNLRDTCDVLVAAETLGNALSREATFTTEASSVVCRIQPTVDIMQTVQGRQGTVNNYDVFFPTNRILLPHKHVLRFVDPSGNTVLAGIETTNESDRVDVCMRAQVKVKP